MSSDSPSVLVFQIQAAYWPAFLPSWTLMRLSCVSMLPEDEVAGWRYVAFLVGADQKRGYSDNLHSLLNILQTTWEFLYVLAEGLVLLCF